MKNTNNRNDLMLKAQSILFSNQDILESLVEVMETVCLRSVYEGSEIEYQITNKDVGSLCEFIDHGASDGFVSILDSIGLEDTLKFHTVYENFEYCKPYHGGVKLHFKPFINKDDVLADIKDRSKHFAVLWSDGEIVVLSVNDNHYTDWETDRFHVVGYTILDFVNTVLEK